MSQIKTAFSAIVHGILPTSTITSVEYVLDNMFTVVKIVGDTMTVKLHDSLGGFVFELKWHEEIMQGDNGPIYVKVWDAFPQEVQQAIAEFIKSHLPNGYFVNFLPSPEYIQYIASKLATGSDGILVNTLNGTVVFAGKVFILSGFLPAFILSMALRTLFRVCVDKKLTMAKVAQDVATVGASTLAAFGTKLFIISMFVHPPAVALWLVPAVAGVACARGVKMLIKKKI